VSAQDFVPLTEFVWKMMGTYAEFRNILGYKGKRD